MKRIVFMIAVAGLLFAPHKANAVEGLSAGISGGPYYQRTRMPGSQSESVTLKEHGWAIAPKVSYEIQHKGDPQFAVEFEPQVLLSRNIKHNHPGFTIPTTTYTYYQLSTDAGALNDLETTIRNFYDSDVDPGAENVFYHKTPWYRSGLLCRISWKDTDGDGTNDDFSACTEPVRNSISPDLRYGADLDGDGNDIDSHSNTFSGSNSDDGDEKFYFTPIGTQAGGTGATDTDIVREWVARTAVQNILAPLPPLTRNSGFNLFDTLRYVTGNTLNDASSAAEMGDSFFAYIQDRNLTATDVRRDLFNAYLDAVNDIPNQGGGGLTITGDLNQWRLYMLMDLARRFNHFDETVDNPAGLITNIFDNQREELGAMVDDWLATYAPAEASRILAAMRAVTGDDDQLNGDVSQLPQTDVADNNRILAAVTATTHEPAEISAMTHVILPVWFTVSKIAANGKLGGHLGVGTGVMLYNLGDRSPTVTDGVSWVGLAKAGFSGQFGGGIRVTWEARLHQALSRPENIDDVWGVSGTAGITVPFSLSF